MNYELFRNRWFLGPIRSNAILAQILVPFPKPRFWETSPFLGLVYYLSLKEIAPYV